MQSAIEYAAIPTINLTPLFLVTNPPTNSLPSDTLQVSASLLKNSPQHSFRFSTTYFYSWTLKFKLYKILKFANMLYLQNYVVYSFNLSKVFFTQRILEIL